MAATKAEHRQDEEDNIRRKKYLVPRYSAPAAYHPDYSDSYKHGLPFAAGFQRWQEGGNFDLSGEIARAGTGIWKMGVGATNAYNQAFPNPTAPQENSAANRFGNWYNNMFPSPTASHGGDSEMRDAARVLKKAVQPAVPPPVMGKPVVQMH